MIWLYIRSIRKKAGKEAHNGSNRSSVKKQCYIIDILPKKVPADSKGSFFDVEAYFLDHNRQYVFQNKFTAIILKLMCYYPIAVFSYDNYRLIRYPSPQTVVDLIAHAKNTLGILFGENTLFLFEKDGLNISVYNPNHDMQELITSLAQAEGLFWRKSEQWDYLKPIRLFYSVSPDKLLKNQLRIILRGESLCRVINRLDVGSLRQ